MTDVVVRTRAAMKSTIARHEWPSERARQRATRELLALVATVPYRGDDHAYVFEAWSLACALMNPIVERNRAVMALLRLKTSKTVH